MITAPRDNTFLLELASQPVAAWFSSLPSDTIKDIFSPSAAVIPPAFHLICRFVPCNGSFDPADRSNIDEIELRHNLQKRAITSASWIRDPKQRAAGQQVANLRLICSSADAANALLTQEVIIGDRAVVVAKDKKDPIRCNKCQSFGHIKASCTGDARCSYCASDSHTADDCPIKGSPSIYRCSNCNGGHATHD